MTRYLLDASGRIVALASDNIPAAPVPPKFCACCKGAAK
jgi:hypothetical protein